MSDKRRNCPSTLNTRLVRVYRDSNENLIKLSKRTGLTVADLVQAALPLLDTKVMAAAKKANVSKTELNQIAGEELAKFILEDFKK